MIKILATLCNVDYDHVVLGCELQRNGDLAVINLSGALSRDGDRRHCTHQTTRRRRHPVPTALIHVQEVCRRDVKGEIEFYYHYRFLQSKL